MAYFWLSFAADEGFLGALIIEADDPTAAVMRSHELGLNPGGEVMIIRAPMDKLTEAERIRTMTHTDRLMSRAELQELGFRPKRIGDLAS